MNTLGKTYATAWLAYLLLLLTPTATIAQQPDTVLIKHFMSAARQAFHAGQFEKNILLTDSLAQVYADGGDFIGYAIFNMYNGWTNLNELKDYDRAGFYADRALQTVEEKLDGQLPYLSDLYGLLAGVYSGIGNSEKALEYQRLALKVVGDMGKTGTFGDYVANSNLGQAYLDLRQWSAAMPFLERARKVILQVGEKEDKQNRFYFNAAQLQARITQVYLGMQQVETALREAQLGLSYAKEDTKPRHFNFHEIYLAAANAYSANDQPEKAAEYFQLLAEIYGENFGPQSVQMSNLYKNRAAAAIHQGRLTEALTYNKQAMASIGLQVDRDQLQLVSKQGNSHCLTCEPDLFDQRVRLLWQLGNTEEQPGRYLRACLAVAEQALESLQELRKTLLFREGSKQVLFGQFQNMLKRGSLAAQRLYEREGDMQYLEEAFKLAEQSKANVLLEALVLARAEAYADLPPDVLEQERSLSLALVRQEKLLEEARIERDTPRMEAIRDGSLFRGKQQYEAFLQGIRKDYPQYFSARYEVPVPSLANLQEELEPGELMIYYLLNREENLLQLMAVDSEGMVLENRPWTASDEQLVEQYYQALQQTLIVQTNRRRAFIEQSHALYQLLLQPLAAQLEGKRRLIIVADDLLHYIPFETLLPTDKDAGFTDLDFLIRDVAVSYQYSGTIFLENKHKAIPQTKDLLAFAPVFQASDGSPQLASSDRSVLESDLSIFDKGHFSPLPWSEREVQDLSELFDAADQTVLLHQAASEEALKAAMAEGYRYLHLATHSFANQRNPRFSGIACATEEGEEADEDGILYAGEIYRQKIRSDLAVLSSCESGLGQLVSGEGMLGLNRSFIYAGVPNVLYSLWRVNDRRSSELMEAFYRSVLSGKPYYEALRQAKLKLLEDPQTALPIHWSAFTLIGR